jgi:anti-sigma B factor antagonist
MRVETTRTDGVAVLSFSGKLMRDGSDEALVRACDEVLGVGAFVVLDLTRVSWMDSSGVGALVSCAKHAGERGSSIRVALPPDGPVQRVFALCHLDRVFETARDVPSAVAGFPRT